MQYESFFEAIERGGFVAWPLVASATILGFVLAYRVWLLRWGPKGTWSALVHRRSEASGQASSLREMGADLVYAFGRNRQAILPALRTLSHETERYTAVCRTIVIVAPLAGLLGTVSGMMETFLSLGDMALHSQDGGIAGGISEALFSTQLGLAVAIPGLICSRLLDRRAAAIRSEFDQLEQQLEVQ